MTDAYLMDANCIHDTTWYECTECSQPQQERTLMYQPHHVFDSKHEFGDVAIASFAEMNDVDLFLAAKRQHLPANAEGDAEALRWRVQSD